MSTKKKKREGYNQQDHRHCIICGHVISPERDPPVCEGLCEEELMKRQKRSRIFNVVWLIMVFGLLIAILMMGLLPVR
ncbi:MAG: DUF2116 family Zn-ribbon domain-containing protein [Candidatus Nezhaarchaeota archaeon]|nr:DUF2116 family Zn-ribbon domain-containing protein [Candidatus Nezhaarchaeota archaeon]MCX8141865.1 DUF2116 family Zn-ribbon domain-containing protein [Candidatus Nezhaarchaeota archaeon]MDW8050354.1 DUF2116 family Zn-ribbon domain-containing protein [Nitrososphaerota archaeon]